MPAPTIRFRATLQRPAEPKGASWCFIVVPVAASAKLPSRGMVTVDGRIAGQAFRIALEPDGRRSHWFKVGRALRLAAGIAAGDVVDVAIAPVGREPAPRVPADLRAALAADVAARTQWTALTPVARRDWIQWITTAKQAETRARRIDRTRAMLASGKRRACCFDRSGIYGGNLSAPTAAPLS